MTQKSKQTQENPDTLTPLGLKFLLDEVKELRGDMREIQLLLERIADKVAPVENPEQLAEREKARAEFEAMNNRVNAAAASLTIDSINQD